jgi:hypothetical protein
MSGVIRVGLFAVVAASLAFTVLVRAQGRGQPAAPAPRAIVPTAASSIVLRPDAHIGQMVSMACVAEAVLSKTAFTVDQGAAAGTEVLVIAPALNAAVEPNAALTVVGEVFRFDPVEVAKRARDGYVLDLPPDIAVRYQGRPAVFATSVVTADLVDIGKRLPPPLTPAEAALREAMVAINSNNGALRKGLETPEAATVQKQIAELKTAFTAANRFFTERKAEDALGWSGEALKFIAAMETAAAASSWDDVRGAATGLNGLCGRCHTARRIRLEDGSFRFRGE